jgi:hypothetical protein
MNPQGSQIVTKSVPAVFHPAYVSRAGFLVDAMLRNGPDCGARPVKNNAMRTIEWSLAEHNYRAGFERWAIPGCRDASWIRAQSPLGVS